MHVFVFERDQVVERGHQRETLFQQYADAGVIEPEQMIGRIHAGIDAGCHALAA